MILPGSVIQNLIHRLRAARLRFSGAEVASHCRLEGAILARRGFREGRPGRIRIAEGCWIDRGVVLDAFGGSVDLARGIYIGPYSVIFGHGGVEIGENTSIAMHCSIVSSNHGVPDRARLIQSQPDVLKATRIGRDVWLGAGVVVLGGVTVGDGCVVGAGAVVSRDLPAYSVSIGVPARVVNHRP
jgi:acetyltransferase-like isoleucine patch superfamily enzyme